MNYTEKFNDLYEQMRLDVINKVREIGKESVVGFKTIVVTNDELNFNLGEGSSYLIEIGEDNMFDQYGYSYSFSNLDIEDFCSLVDYLNELK